MPKNCVQRMSLSFHRQFRLHASSHYSLISELISADIKSELRVMLRKFFTRVGYVYDIVASSVEIPTWAAKLHTYIQEWYNLHLRSVSCGGDTNVVLSKIPSVCYFCTLSDRQRCSYSISSSCTLSAHSFYTYRDSITADVRFYVGLAAQY